MGARMRSRRLAAPTFRFHELTTFCHLPMIDREKVLAVLHRRFPGAAPDQFAAAANAIVGLDDEWEDVTVHEPEFGYHFSAQCGEICYLAEQVQVGGEFRVFKKRGPAA